MVIPDRALLKPIDPWEPSELIEPSDCPNTEGEKVKNLSIKCDPNLTSNYNPMKSPSAKSLFCQDCILNCTMPPQKWHKSSITSKNASI